MSAAFTPGPWELTPWQLGARQRHRAIWAAMAPGYEARGVLAHTMGQRPLGVNTANAFLIAAAPELYEAAARALNYIENTESELGIKLDSGDALRAVLAKARGQ